MPGVAWLFYSMLVLLLLALLGAALFFWQHTPARNKIPRAQRRRVVALQQMEALAKRLRQQVGGYLYVRPPALHPNRWIPPQDPYSVSFRRQGAWGNGGERTVPHP